jgi:hypothetical protein
MNARRIVTWLSGPLLALFFLWLSFRNVSLTELGAELRDVQAGLLLAYLATIPLHMLVRSLRWQAMLEPVRPRLPLRELFSATTIGYMASLLPGRVGEVLRPLLIARRTRIPAAPTMATVGVERVVLDLLAVLFAGALGLMLPGAVSGLGAHADQSLIIRLRGVGTLLMLAALGLLVTVHLIGRFRVPLSSWLEARAEGASLRFVPPVLRWLDSLTPGFGSMGTVPGLLRIAAWTAAVWGVIGVGMHFGIEACGVDLAPGGVLVMLPILAVGIGIPSPGGTGTFHYAMKLGLVALFAVDEAAAVGAGLVVHAGNWLPILAMGGWCVARGGLARPEAPEGGDALEPAEGALR